MLRILHVVPTYLPAVRYGGPIVAVHGLCRALAERGHDVSVFTTNVDGDGTVDATPGEAVGLDGVRVTYFPSPLRRIYWSPAMRAALRRCVRGFDVVHTHAVYLWPGVAAAREARRAGVPHVISPRGMLVPELIRERSALAKNAWLRLFETRGFRDAAAVHFTSMIEWEDAKRVGLPLNAPIVIPNGIDATARPDVPREARTLVYLGRISWKKGLERAIEALPSLPGVRLVAAGNDEEGLAPRLADLARRLGVAERVELRGPLYGPDKDAFLARGTLFVLLSRSENFGNAVLEALAMETPAVLSPEVGVAPEVVAAGAGILGVDGIGALLEDAERRAAMGRNGRALVESRFAWSRIATEFEQAYTGLRRPS